MDPSVEVLSPTAATSFSVYACSLITPPSAPAETPACQMQPNRAMRFMFEACILVRFQNGRVAQVAYMQLGAGRVPDGPT